LLEQLERANIAFAAAKEGDASLREQALQFKNVYYKYKEIGSDLEVGRNLYNDLSKIVGRFRDDCKAYSYSRGSEATQIES
jgi:programmed cell death 6-interacting protein